MGGYVWGERERSKVLPARFARTVGVRRCRLRRPHVHLRETLHIPGALWGDAHLVTDGRQRRHGRWWERGVRGRGGGEEGVAPTLARCLELSGGLSDHAVRRWRVVRPRGWLHPDPLHPLRHRRRHRAPAIEVVHDCRCGKHHARGSCNTWLQLVAAARVRAHAGAHAGARTRACTRACIGGIARSRTSLDWPPSTSARLHLWSRRRSGRRFAPFPYTPHDAPVRPNWNSSTWALSRSTIRCSERSGRCHRTTRWFILVACGLVSNRDSGEMPT